MVMALIEHEVPEHELVHLLELRKENLEIVEVEVDRGSKAEGKRIEELQPSAGNPPHLGHAGRPGRDRPSAPTELRQAATRCWRS